jgi:thiol:disulfide interchange protein DsbD
MISKDHFKIFPNTSLFNLKYLFLFVIGTWLTTSTFAQVPKPSSSFDPRLEFSVTPKSFTTQDTLSLQLKVTLPKGWHINSADPKDEFAIPTRLIWEGTGLQFGEPLFPPSKNYFIKVLNKELELYEGTFTIVTRVWRSSSSPSLYSKEPILPRNLKGTLKYQACSDQICLRPTSKSIEPFLDIPSSASAVKEIDYPRNETQDTYIEPVHSESNAFQGPWIYVFISLLLGGLLLNLTPCVYPLIAITISLFGQQTDQKASSRIFRSILYVGGMILSFSTLGVLASLSGALFGSFLQSSWAQLGIAGIFILLALSSFGLYEIRLPSALMGKAMGASNTGGNLGSLLAGLFAGLLAAPCIGPFVLALIVYVAQENNIGKGVWMFATLALGMGFPYLILGIATGAVQKLPRSGNWMVDVKKILAIVLLMLANYYARGFLTEAVYSLIFGSLLLYLALYLNPFAPWDSNSTISKVLHTLIRTIAFIILLISAKFVLQGLGLNTSTTSAYTTTNSSISTNTSQQTGYHWTAYSEKAFKKALANKQPILIDFESKIWCAACREMEEKTYSQPIVHQALKKYALFKVDVDKHPSAAELQRQFSIRGIPTVIVYNSQGKEVKPIVGFVPPEEFIGMLPGEDTL